MSASALIQQLLLKRELPFSVVTAPGRSASGEWILRTVALDNLANVEILRDTTGYVMAVYPASHQIDYLLLNQLLRRELVAIEGSEIESLVNKCQHSDAAQFEREQNLQIIIDVALSDQEHVHFHASDNSGLLRINAANMQLIVDNLLIGSAFSKPLEELSQERDVSAGKPRLDIREKVKSLKGLPTMPDLSARILAMRSDPDATVHDLAELVNQDPALSAQIIRYSNSAFFALPKPVTDIESAIFKVLGFEGVSLMAIGLAMVRPFTLAENGPLGKQRFWTHSVYTAALAQYLCKHCPATAGLKPGTAYLAGLIHDIGVLVLAHSFRSEYFWLNKLAMNKSGTPMRFIEANLLGLDHTELGTILMQSWQMPAELIAVVSHHHNLDYSGEHSHYVNLVSLADCMLKGHEISDADQEDVPPQLYRNLGLDEETALTIADEVMQEGTSLKDMILSLCA